MPQRVVLNVAEKPSVARGVSAILAGTASPPSRHGRSGPNRIFEFECDVPPWGRCSMKMTSVAGHLSEIEFDKPYK
jgi:DNA topoisomerase-3